MSEQIEWIVGYFDLDKTLHRASDGAQTVFGKTSAEKLVKRAGPPYEVLHAITLLSPADHAEATS